MNCVDTAAAAFLHDGFTVAARVPPRYGRSRRRRPARAPKDRLRSLCPLLRPCPSMARGATRRARGCGIGSERLVEGPATPRQPAPATPVTMEVSVGHARGARYPLPSCRRRHLALMTKLELSGGNQYLRAAAGGGLPGASRDSDPTWTRRRSEVHPPHLVGAQRANKLAHGAINEKQDEEPELDGPEVRPHDLVQQLPVSCRQVAGAPPEGTRCSR